MRPFTGFPSGRDPYVPIPETFFTNLLVEIEDTFELKVTLFIFWRMAQRKGARFISDRELLQDEKLLASLKRRGDPRPPEERLYTALDQAVARGTLLRAQLAFYSPQKGEAEEVTWYFFHTARSRKVVEELEGGQLVPASFFNGILPLQEEKEEEKLEPAHPAAIGPGGYFNFKGAEPFYEAFETFEAPKVPEARVQLERPNIFVLYEQNIGLLSPLLADQLAEAERQYPYEWLEDAFSEAVQRNKRNWSYIRAILRRWETEGRQ
jgi:DNA replication protein